MTTAAKNPHPLWEKKKKVGSCSVSVIFPYLQLEPRILIGKKKKKKLKEIVLWTYVPVMRSRKPHICIFKM